ncbi:hypothetical protein [Niveispirillum sp. BGYR6]|uniref:hypothetical protein n=1 Tax=Niveispirillum sp. BGYR6 TaxID=2971249 RepID=UPI0022B99717|nr:hypothetical protein [Niveispirillum sp. BGYR6]MDG5494272.1 hypothetical protein [Niveispirillum sp. BGYR6]
MSEINQAAFLSDRSSGFRPPSCGETPRCTFLLGVPLYEKYMSWKIFENSSGSYIVYFICIFQIN